MRVDRQRGEGGSEEVRALGPHPDHKPNPNPGTRTAAGMTRGGDDDAPVPVLASEVIFLYKQRGGGVCPQGVVPPEGLANQRV